MRNKFSKTRPNQYKRAYNTKSNGYLSLVMKAKKGCCNNLDHKNVTDNKTFWKSIKLLFFYKSGAIHEIRLVEQDLILDQKKILQSSLPILYEGSFKFKLPKIPQPLSEYRLYWGSDNEINRIPYWWKKKTKKKNWWKVTNFLVVNNIFPRPIILPGKINSDQKFLSNIFSPE